MLKDSSVVLLGRDLPQVDTRLEWGHECAVRCSERGNDSMDRTAAIADHKGVLNDPDLAAEIDLSTATRWPTFCAAARH